MFLLELCKNYKKKGHDLLLSDKKIQQIQTILTKKYGTCRINSAKMKQTSVTVPSSKPNNMQYFSFE